MTTARPRALDGASILANARAIAPVLRDEADVNERCRRLSTRTVEALRVAGVFRMPMPRAWGGPELDICTQVEVIEVLAHADGAAGWCAMIGSDGGFYTSHVDDAVGRALYSNLDMVTAGWVQPGGELQRVDGGFRLRGHWQFGSGANHADVLVGGAIVLDGDRPVTGSDGRPETRVAMLPAEHFQVLDNWDTTGLAGTGSHDYAIDDTFVPAELTFRFGEVRREGTLYAWPGLFFANFAGVPLGIARAALDTAEEIVAGKVLRPEMRPARDDPRVRAAIAQAEAMVASARSYVYDVLGDAWSTLERGAQPSRRQRAAMATVHGYTSHTCRDAVRLVADTVGTDAIRRGNLLERHQRDLTTVCRHVLCQPRTLDVAGGFLIDGAGIDHPLVSERVL